MKSRRARESGSDILPALRRLAALCGLQISYQDVFGKRHTASTASLKRMLHVLGVPVENARDAHAALRNRLREHWDAAVEPVTVAWDGKPAEIELRLPATTAGVRGEYNIRLEPTAETGNGIRSVFKFGAPEASTTVEGIRHGLWRLRLPAGLPFGYHNLRIAVRGKVFESLLISAPSRAYQIAGRIWGGFCPLYALHSRQSWGGGDFSDLDQCASWLSEQGAALISTLPMQAAFLDDPFDPSPYSPVSRLFWSEFYVDPRRSPEFENCAAARRLVGSADFERELRELRAQPLVDYRRQMILKRGVIEFLARHLEKSPSDRRDRFQKYVGSHTRLQDYAAFRAVCERQRRGWPDWPVRQRGGTVQPADFDLDASRYHAYAQWLAEEQLVAVAGKHHSRRAALYLDFPLGVHPHGYDVWRKRELFALGASGGAPPDSLFSGGQKWGFPPLHPEAIRKDRYAYMIDCLRHAFRHAAQLRIDHVMGFHRLFWVPNDVDARDGAYVLYKPDELYAILSLESHRHRAGVAGENLGTVPRPVNAALERHGISKMYVMQYQASARRRPLPPVPQDTVASLNTHDMPPFAAFLDGDDIRDFQALGLFNSEDVSRQRKSREAVVHALSKFLLQTRDGFARGKKSQLLRAALEWLSSGPAGLVLVNLEDLWLEKLPQNVPGTNSERPNWKRKAKYSIEEFSNNSKIKAVLRRIRELRGEGA